MVTEGSILVGRDENENDIFLSSAMANRHGLIAGATGTGKTVTLRTLAEGFSSQGVPVFISDVKGDIASEADKFPVDFWDIYQKSGIPLRTTVSEMGPVLLSRILQLTDVQSDILTVIFKIADDEKLLLTDTKDLKAMLSYVTEKSKEYESSYGKMSGQSLAAITRAVVALEAQGADVFFGEPALSIMDLLSTENGKGIMHILDASSLINSSKLYGAFLLWIMSEIFELLPEVGDLDKPKLVFFFDEAHLLFKDAPKALIDKIEQVVKLIRSKGVGIFFCTQNPADIPGGVLAQLSNKLEHALHAYSPNEQKGVKAVANAFPVSKGFDTYEAIMSLGTGEAIVSFLNEDGVPTEARRVKVNLPEAKLDALDSAQREARVKQSLLYSKYFTAVDNESAYEFLQRRGLELQEEAEEREALKKAQKEADKRASKEANVKKRAVKSVGSSVAGTIGREVGKEVGKSFGRFGKTLGGNVGASLGRGLLSTLLKM